MKVFSPMKLYTIAYKGQVAYRFFAASEERAKELAFNYRLACNRHSRMKRVDPGDLYIVAYKNCPAEYHEGRAYLVQQITSYNEETMKIEPCVNDIPLGWYADGVAQPIVGDPKWDP